MDNLAVSGTNNTASAASDTNHLITDKSSPENIVKNEQEKKQDRKIWSILSIIATIVPIIVWSYCYVASRGGGNENGAGVVWWLMVIYYWTLGVPLAAISIAFGIMGLKTSLRWLSIISLSLKAAMIVAIVLFL